MMKLYTPINIGALELSHRVTFDCAADPSTRTVVEDQVRRTLDMLPSGTLIFVQVDHPVRPRSQAKAVEGASFSGWRRLIEHQHDAGRIVVGRLRPPRPTSRAYDDGVASGLMDRGDLGIADMARRMQDVRFDGVEYDCTDAISAGILPAAPTAHPHDQPNSQPPPWLSAFADAVAQLSSVWAVERLGVRLAPFQDGAGAHAPAEFARVLELLSDHEVAYAHVVGLCTSGGSARSVVAGEAGRRFRRAFPNVMIASGHLDVVSAADLVESRWADGICLPLEPAAVTEPSIGEVIRILNQHR